MDGREIQGCLRELTSRPHRANLNAIQISRWAVCAVERLRAAEVAVEWGDLIRGAGGLLRAQQGSRRARSPLAGARGHEEGIACKQAPTPIIRQRSRLRTPVAAPPSPRLRRTRSAGERRRRGPATPPYSFQRRWKLLRFLLWKDSSPLWVAATAAAPTVTSGLFPFVTRSDRVAR